MIPTVAHFRADYARISETFIYDVIAGARGQRPVPVFNRRLWEQHFKLPDQWVQTALDFQNPGPVDGLAAELAALDVSLCHAHFGYDLPLAAAAAQALNVPVICSFHGADASSYLRLPQWEEFYRAVLPSVDSVVLDYMGMADRLVELGARRERICVIRTGIDLAFWPLREKWTASGPLRLISAGRLVEKKGHALLIHAIARARREGLDVRLTLVGEGKEQRVVDNLVIAYELEDAVRLTGLLSREGIRDLLPEHDVFVLPSYTAEDGNEETTPLVLKEAMAAGLPVLSTFHGGIPEVVADGVSGILVEEGAIGALGEGLRRILAWRDRWPEMGQAGRAIVEREYNLDRTLDDWARLYASLAVLESSVA